MDLITVATTVASLGRGTSGISAVSPTLGVNLLLPVVSSATTLDTVLLGHCATSIATAAATTSTSTGRPSKSDTNFNSAGIKLCPVESLLSGISL